MNNKRIIIFLILIAAATSISYSQDSPNNKTIKHIGERMSIAILPFESKEVDQKIVDEILNELISAMSKQNRFDVTGRSKLDKIIKEWCLELLWKIDISMAAEIGREYGVDALILATIATAPENSTNIDAFVLDAKSGLIVISHGTKANNDDSLGVEKAVERLADKITQSLPLVEGNVSQVNNDFTILLDSGKKAGLRRGMRCTVFKKDIERKHPITGIIIKPKNIILGEVIIVESLDEIATAQLLELSIGSSTISVGDKFITK